MSHVLPIEEDDRYLDHLHNEFNQKRIKLYQITIKKLKKELKEEREKKVFISYGKQNKIERRLRLMENVKPEIYFFLKDNDFLNNNLF